MKNLNGVIVFCLVFVRKMNNSQHFSLIVPKKTSSKDELQLATDQSDINTTETQVGDMLETLENNIHVVFMFRWFFVIRIIQLHSTFMLYFLFLLLKYISPFSLMSTPPPERVAVKTYVSAFSKERAISAIKFELQRGGQVFYVVPRIKGHSFVIFR